MSPQPDIPAKTPTKVLTEDHYHYVFIRSDLPWGVQLAQTIHAAGESAGLFGGPVPKGTNAVSIALPHESAVRTLSEALDRKSITHVVIVETEGEYAGQAMAIGIPPTRDRAPIRRLTSHLPLAGGNRM